MFDLIDTLGKAFLGQARAQARAEVTANGLLIGEEVPNLALFPARDQSEEPAAAAA
jgi:hypothetical protein